MTNIRAMWRTAPVASDSGPTMKPGVSHRNTIGHVERVAALQEPRRLVGGGRVDRTTEVRRVVGDDADRPALDPRQRGDRCLAPKPASQFEHRAGVAQRVDDRAHVVRAHAVLGNEMAQRALVDALPLRRRRPRKYERYCLATPTASRFVVARATSITPFATCTSTGPIAVGSYVPSPPPSIIAGPPMPMFESSVAMITSQQPSSAALPAKQ